MAAMAVKVVQHGEVGCVWSIWSGVGCCLGEEGVQEGQQFTFELPGWNAFHFRGISPHLPNPDLHWAFEALSLSRHLSIASSLIYRHVERYLCLWSRNIHVRTTETINERLKPSYHVDGFDSQMLRSLSTSIPFVPVSAIRNKFELNIRAILTDADIVFKRQIQSIQTCDLRGPGFEQLTKTAFRETTYYLPTFIILDKLFVAYKLPLSDSTPYRLEKPIATV